MKNNPVGLGKQLLHAGYINQEQLDSALYFQKTEGSLLGEILVSHGYMTKEKLDDFVSSNSSAHLGELLMHYGYLSADQFREALSYQQKYGGRLGTICVSLGFLTERQLENVLKKHSIVHSKLGDELLSQGIITPEQLNNALEMQKRSGGRLGEIFVFMEYVTQEQLYRILANQQDLGRPGKNAAPVRNDSLPYELAQKYKAVLLRNEKKHAVIGVVEKLGDLPVRELSGYLHKPVEQVLISDAEKYGFWEQIYNEQEAKISIFGLYDENPEYSAIVTFTSAQVTVLLGLALLILAGVMINWKALILGLCIFFQLIYLLMAMMKFVIVLKGARNNTQLRYSDEEIYAVKETDLPVYTLLIPVYKEKEVISQLIERIKKMDYPKHKLDVRILLEENDIETIQIIKSMDLPFYFTMIVVPESKPQTKPKACNYGLLQARGEYVVIYDAEDRPEPDQLKKAYLAFKELSQEYVCVQAKLNYFNSDQNILTKVFTQEYSMWFELLLVGIMQMNVPIPLGGTSNHFKMSFLRSVGGWDPFNVTEDADLGIRLYQYHYKTAILDSRTWEEANSKTKNWIRQRSRWIKGYMQTFFVHMRRPVELYKKIGFRGFVGYIAMIFGTPFLPLINPIFWALFVIWILTKAQWIQSMFPGILYYVALIQMVVGNFIFIYMNMLGTYYVIKDCARKKQYPFSYKIIKYGLFVPFYWILMSVAAYKALFQFFINPYYWEKTQHGLTEGAPETAEGMKTKIREKTD